MARSTIKRYCDYKEIVHKLDQLIVSLNNRDLYYKYFTKGALKCKNYVFKK